MINEINTNVNTNSNSGAMTIHSRTQFEQLRTVFNKKEKGVCMTSITIGKKGAASISILQVPYNLGTNLLNIEPTFVKTNVDSARKIERFTKDAINVVIKDAGYASLVSMTIYRVGDGLDERFYTDTVEPGSVINLTTKEFVKASVVKNDDGSLLPGVRTYGGRKGGQISSASQLRKYSITMMENSDEDKVRRYIDHIDYGSFGIIEGAETTASGLVKHSARLGQAHSPVCMEDIPVGTMAIYAGKWKNPEGNQYNDGSAYVTTRFAAKACSLASNGKFDVKERAVLGMAFQCRPWKSKVMARCVESMYIEEMFSFHKYDIVRIDRNNVSSKEQEEFNKLFIGKEKSAFAGKLIVIYDNVNAPIDFMTDLNGMKATYDLTRSSGFNVLDIGNVQDTETGASTSMQMLQTLLYFDYNKGMEYIQKKGKDCLNDKLNNLLNTEAQVPGVDEFDKLYASGTIPKIARKFVLENNTAMYRSISDNYMKGISGDIRNLKFKLPGVTNKIVPDFAMDFEQMTLGIAKDGKVEVYCPAAEQYFTELNLLEESWIISGYKYPKMHVQEVLIARVVSCDEIGKRIDSLEIASKQKSLLRRHYKSLSRSIVVVPAIELLKNMLAGMDFDADAATLVFDVEFNNILVKSDKKPMAVVIEDNNEKSVDVDKLITVKPNMAWTVLRSFTKNKNRSIGEITFMNDLTVAMLIMAQNDQLDEVRKIMKSAFGIKDNTEAYVSPLKLEYGEYGIPMVRISENLMNKIVGKIKNMALSKENMLAALYDLVSINRMLQEITIDSAKTNRILEIAYDLNKVAKSRVRSPFALEINWGKAIDKLSYVKWTVDHEPSGLSDEKGNETFVYHLEENFHKLRKNIARDLFRAAVTLRGVNHEFEDDTLAMIKRVDARFAEERAMVIEAKYIYDDLTGIKRQETKTYENDVECLYPIKEDYRLNIDALSNHIRRITRKMTPVERALMLVSVGGNSAFAFTVCPEEFVHMIIKYFADIDFAGEKLVKCMFETGEVIDFIGGMANADGKIAIAKSNLTGKFEICEYNGKKYAAKKIVDIVKIPEIDESITVVKLKNMKSIIDVEEVSRKISTGLKTRLLALGGAGGDYVTIDGERVFKFCCNDNKLKKDKILKNMYNGATGTVARLVTGTSCGNTDKLHHVAIMVMQNTVMNPLTMTEIKEGKELAAKEKAARAKITVKNPIFNFNAGDESFC